ncbi:MAG: hypothetical protein LUE29_13970 [Lachnospiraceae bacterium]|nr:hypothetical protein [Lachnospiraceae bacterium]
MLNEEKIILMTKLAIYEKGEGKKEIPMSRYYRNDYVGVHMLYTFLSVTAGYVLLFALYIARDVEEFLSSLTTMDLKKFLFTALAIYIGAELFFLFVTWILYRYRFKKNRRHLNEYYGNLKKLKKIQKKEQAEAIKMAEGTENAPKEETEEDDSPAEEAGEEDIFREPKQKGLFRKRKAENIGEEKPHRKQTAGDPEFRDEEEDVLTFFDEEEPEDDLIFAGEEETDGDENRPDGKNAEADVEFIDGKEADREEKFPDRENTDGAVKLSWKKADGRDMNLYDEKENGRGNIMEVPETNPMQTDGHTADPGLTAGRTGKRTQESEPVFEQPQESTSAPEQPQENAADPELALEQALKKMVLDISEDEEEDEDGFTFSS